MAEIIEKNGRRYWVDPVGDEIPENYVSPEDKKRDKLVEQVIKLAAALNEKLVSGKQSIVEKTDSYLEDVAGRYGETWKGNTKISNFRGDKAIEVSINELINFDERLQVAKKKVDNCINSWTKDSNKPLQTLAKKAFRTDKQGKLNKQLVLSLLSWDIKEPEWEEAMEIIKSSIKVVSTRTYYNFYIKDSDGTQKAIILNFSAL